jgi:hypothetical protein
MCGWFVPVSNWAFGYFHGHTTPDYLPRHSPPAGAYRGRGAALGVHHSLNRKFATMKTNHLLATILLPVSLWANASPFIVSADGQEVTDTKTGLIWRRCAEGMTASGGTCTGTASTYTHEAALTLASTQSTATGLAWRLPNVKELSSIADKSRSNPAIDTAAFPATPASWFWSSSPYVGNASSAWFVFFNDGVVSAYGRSYSDYVRLVRAGQ